MLLVDATRMPVATGAPGLALRPLSPMNTTGLFGVLTKSIPLAFFRDFAAAFGKLLEAGVQFPAEKKKGWW